jgi:hypothetical protein
MISQIVVHILPHEIDWFEWQSRQLKIGSYYINKSDRVIVDVTLNLNFIDWESSQIPQSFFIAKFEQIKQLYDWCEPIFEIDVDKKCLGCGDKRKQSIELSTADNIIYLDSDIIFKPETLFYLIEYSKIISNEYYIISPEIVKLWDNSWDVLVNEKYINDSACPIKYINFDPFLLLNEKLLQTNLKPINNFKFGGGWFNLISTKLLKLTGIPDSLNPYGPDDTYVMYCSEHLKNKGYNIQQYVVKNIIVTENNKYRLSPYSNFLSSINGEVLRKEFREKSNNNLSIEVQNFINNN